MKTRLAMLGVIVALATFSMLARAEDAKQVTLQGDMVCPKCALHEGDKCGDVLVVKDGDKEVHYTILAGEGVKVEHVCKGTKAVKITGTVGEKDGMKTITATKIEEVKA